MRAVLAGLLALAFYPHPVLAQPAPQTEVEAGLSHEDLDRGRADWKSRYVEAAHRFTERTTLYGLVRETERFGMRDSELAGALYFPLGERWSAVAEASHSPQHHVLPRYSVRGELQRSFASGWGVSAGLRHSEYARSDANILTLGAERYSGAWRAAYTLYNGRPEGAGSGSAHRVELRRYYGGQSSVGIGIAAGREVENAGPPAGVVTTDVKSLTLIGRHWVAARWALSYELFAQDHSGLYRRDGMRLGIRHAF